MYIFVCCVLYDSILTINCIRRKIEKYDASDGGSNPPDSTKLLGDSVLTIFNRSKPKIKMSQEHKDIALKSVNYVFGNDDPEDVVVAKYQSRHNSGAEPIGQINLIRAVADQADTVIKNIDIELKELEDRRNHLLIKKAAHEEMQAVAFKYVDMLNIKITKTN